MTGLSDFFKVIQQEKENQDKELYSLLGEEFSTDSFIDSLFSSAKEEIKKEKVIEEKITKIFDEIISDKNEVIVEEEQEEKIIEEEIEEEEIVQESSEDKSINQYIDFLKETVKNQPQEYQESLTNPSSKEIQELKNLVWQVMRDVRAQGGGGEVNLRYLDDIVGIATNSGSYNGKYLQWNSTTNEAEFVTINSGNISGISTGYYGNFFDTTTQTIVGVSTHQPVRLNTTDLSSQVSIANSSHIIVANSGVYNIQFSLQIDKTTAAGAHIYVWLRKNGLNVPNSATELAVQGTFSEVVAAWNFVVQSEANDYYELVISATDINIRLKAVSASGVVPAIPSVIVSVVSV
jgi:hypothetical protein